MSPSISRKKIDKNQMQFDFDFIQKVDHYIETREQIQDSIENENKSKHFENEFEVCVEIAASVKRAMREWGGTRDHLLDEINAFFGRSEDGTKIDPPLCRNPLTKHMLNNYLSKPTEYPMPAYLLVAIHNITGRLYPAETIVGYEGAKVATGAELRQMTLGKLEENLAEMRKLKRELWRR